jgi:heat shock protein HslJ
MKREMILLALAGLLLAACSPSASTELTGDWQLVSYGNPASPTPAAPDVDTVIEFTDGQISGNVGCNGFGGRYSVKGGSLTFTEMISTLMFCEGPVGDQETATLSVLRDTATFLLDGDTLTITSADGSSVVVLARK